MKCPKCSYVRKSTDDAPEWQCPTCKVAYAKVQQSQTQNYSSEKLQTSTAVKADKNQKSAVRNKGLLKTIGGVVGFAIVFSTVLKHGLGDPSRGSPAKLIAMAAPGSFLLVGMIELSTGIAFEDISEKWDDLPSWQRGVLGLLVVILAIFLAFCGLIIFG